ncbi:VOC family protein [soil metagenome]
MEPILHLSLPVDDLDAARTFYVDTLGCDLGRVRDGWIDVWFYGLQLTLQEHPDQILSPEQTGVRHFGVTLGSDELRSLIDRIGTTQVDWVAELHTDHPGEPHEQTKSKLRDPSGNVIELKAYSDPAIAFEQLGVAGPE